LSYLNHGGYGAVPAPVAVEQQRLRARIERNPTRFFRSDLAELLGDARTRFAAFLHADPDGVVFVANATTGVQTVLASLDLDASSEIVTTDHAYVGVRVQLDVLARRTGCVVKVVPLALPLRDPDEIVDVVTAALSPATTLLVIDQVASPTGVVFPVAAIAAAARAHGIPVLVDGAHAVGMLPVDVAALDVDFWVGNLHKWLCAPKSAAVLSVASPWRDRIRPLVPSAQYDDGLRPSFDWTGTSDPTPIFAALSACDFFDDIGWETMRGHNNALAASGARAVAAALDTDLPVADELSGSMRIIDLGRTLEPDAARSLEQRLYDEHRIEVPITAIDGHRWIRISAQLYNRMSDYELLADVLPGLLRDLD
jgi:isopenicillin-N epimerase